MLWGDCKLVYNKNNRLFEPEYHLQLIKYMQHYHDACDENVWLDQETKTLFSSAQTLSVPRCGQNHNFISNRGNFINNVYPASSGWMLKHYQTLRGCFSDLPEIVTTEFKCGYCDSIKSIHKQDSVFIVGGGPSTNHVDFSKYEHVPKWTMNSFFLNEKVKQLDNVQLVTFLDDVNLDDKQIIELLNDKKPLVVQEISDLGSHRINKIKQMYDDVTFMHTRYRSRLGVGARLIILAILMGVENIYISGMDGYDMTSSDTHSFENNKSIPNWLKHAGPWLQKQQMVVFWDYVLNTLTHSYDFKIHDLSVGQDSVQYKFIQDNFK